MKQAFFKLKEKVFFQKSKQLQTYEFDKLISFFTQKKNIKEKKRIILIVLINNESSYIIIIYFHFILDKSPPSWIISHNGLISLKLLTESIIFLQA